ncbi:MAG: methyltransferase [Deltaproteobacteria bacterium]|nr:methyltransferase [Deltaproteobacteria bacterium]
MTPKKVEIEKIGPYSFIQGIGQKVTNDPLLLADFVLPLDKGDQVIDLGTGTGIIPFLLASKSRAKRITGVEIDTGACSVFERNIADNGLEGRVEAVFADYRDLKSIYKEGSFALVVANPPYIKAGAGRVSPKTERAVARSEVKGTLRELIEISKHLAGDKGRIAYIFPVVRLFEMLDEVRGAGLKPRRLRFIHTSRSRPAKLFLIEAGQEGGLVIEERFDLES